MKLHKRWLEDGIMDDYGLCFIFEYGSELYEYNEYFELFEPTGRDLIELSREGLDSTYWASGCSEWSSARKFTYSPLRQTIMLFIAAMAD